MLITEITHDTARHRLTSGLFAGLCVLTLGSLLGGCAGRGEPGYADRDGATVATRPNEGKANYGTSNSSLDRQADDNKVDLMKYKTSF